MERINGAIRAKIGNFSRKGFTSKNTNDKSFLVNISVLNVNSIVHAVTVYEKI